MPPHQGASLIVTLLNSQTAAYSVCGFAGNAVRLSPASGSWGGRGAGADRAPRAAHAPPRQPWRAVFPPQLDPRPQPAPGRDSARPRYPGKPIRFGARDLTASATREIVTGFAKLCAGLQATTRLLEFAAEWSDSFPKTLVFSRCSPRCPTISSPGLARWWICSPTI